MKKYILAIMGVVGFMQMQAQRGSNDTIRMGAIVVDKDTFVHKWLGEVFIIDKAPKWLSKQRRKERQAREAYSRMRYNVYTVYPYAVAAAFILKDVDSVTNSLHSKWARQDYKRRKENELNKQFKGELQNLSISQGQVLVKLIARQTGRPCYAIVKDLKGGFNARIFQTMALLFDNNLKNSYDAFGEDALIEQFVLEIEAQGHFVPLKKGS